ncbi:hypothetical protein IF1G_07371 [Cordyceps javanica]|uniref:Uncharacterized protein n=1 Tax=Cordyceps javanica TaxID=43265 RepID=A0A545VKT6_9HYPO|nr:hypothetical protein IF1G_07371 [Cordyceps javanica]TQW02343.1 hypothetical protein IF2G_10146 [Cordyceps javanica]
MSQKIWGISPDRLPLPKDELLRVLREDQERLHFSRVMVHSATEKWLLNPQYHMPVDFDSTSELRIEDANDACNRTSAVYLLRDLTDRERRVHESGCQKMALLIGELYRYTYPRWLRPYRSEIECKQFLTKVNVPPASILPLDTCSMAMVDWVRRLHSNFCQRVESIKSKQIGWDEEEERSSMVPCYVMQPVFYAIAVALRTSAYDIHMADFSDTPVLIVCTGQEQGLSAAIDLSTVDEQDRRGVVTDSSGKMVAVETSVRVAIPFLLALEAREQRAFGMKPVQSTRPLTCYELPFDTREALGWDAETMGELRGPSSRWTKQEHQHHQAETSYCMQRALNAFDTRCRRHRWHAKFEYNYSGPDAWDQRQRWEACREQEKQNEA